jgi:hypothetical protein
VGWDSYAQLGVVRQRDDDEMSQASTGSRFSDVSYKPTTHSKEQAQKRGISDPDIKRTKAEGKMSLSIHLNGEEDTNKAKAEIRWWGDRLKESFEQLEVGEVIEKGKQKDRRVQMEMDGSEKMGPRVKEWMKGHPTFDIKDWLQKHDYFGEKKQQSKDVKEWFKEHGYFWEERQRRVLFKLLQGQEGVVVVEGRSAPDEVGVITNYRRNEAGIISKDGYQFDTKGFAENFFGCVYPTLLCDLDADELALDATLTEQGRARIDAASGFWVIGPGTLQYSLSTWPPKKPFLMTAAQHGRANFVDRLMRHYGCDVNYQRLDKDGGDTALHLAAYYGHSDVVSTLLDSGLISNLNLKNKYGETALDCARAGQEAYDKKELRGNNVSIKGPKSLVAKSSCIDFTKRNGWPGWGEIIPLLEAARVDKTQ